MRKGISFLLPILASVFIFSACSSEKEDLQLDSYNEYLPFQVGKYITYRLDSTVFTMQGRAEETHSYHEKHVIDAEITDNLGRPSYRVFRYIRDTAGLQPWTPSGSYFITPLSNSVEVIDDNLRIVKLANPIKEFGSWNGNRYLYYEPYTSLYNFSNDDNMFDWTYTIDGKGETETYFGKTYTDVITIVGADESLNVPITQPDSYASRSLSVEKYAKDLGLIFQEFILWEYQPNPGSSPYKVGFGVKRTIIDNN